MMGRVQPPDRTDLRARVHAALGDPIRLAVVDELAASDLAPVELRRRLHLESNLLAHHLDVLEDVALIERSRSSGDGRRRYVHLRRDTLEGLGPRSNVRLGPAMFVCSANSARSQIAAALWTALTGNPGASGGTHPATGIHPEAVSAARRAGLDLSGASPRSLHEAGELPSLVITVCDRAHEELQPDTGWLHWSIPDPVPTGTAAAFDAALRELHDRIADLAGLAVAS